MKASSPPYATQTGSNARPKSRGVKPSSKANFHPSNENATRDRDDGEGETAQGLQRAFIYGASKSSAMERPCEIVRYEAGLCSLSNLCSFCKLSSSRSPQGSNRRVRISTGVVTPGRLDCMVDLGSRIISHHSIVIKLVLVIGGSRKNAHLLRLSKSVSTPINAVLMSYPHKSCSGVKPARFSIRNRNSFIHGLVPTDRVISKSVVTF